MRSHSREVTVTPIVLNMQSHILLNMQSHMVNMHSLSREATGTLRLINMQSRSREATLAQSQSRSDCYPFFNMQSHSREATVTTPMRRSR